MVYTPLLLLASVCLMLSQTHIDAQNVDVTIEAETSAENRPDLSDRIMWRGRGSEVRTVHLFQGENLDIPICLTTDGFLSLIELKYSNDGYPDPDKLEAFLDGQSLGSFYTFSHTDYGYKWDEFLSYSGFVAKPTKLEAGRHSLNLKAVETDAFGVELDAITVRITGPAARTATPSSLQCLDETTPATPLSNEICEGTTKSVTCPANTVIHVVTANYGRTAGGDVCPHAKVANQNCRSDKSALVSQLCDGKSTCTIRPNNSNMGGDPCVGTYKYLQIEYDCMDGETGSTGGGKKNKHRRRWKVIAGRKFGHLTRPGRGGKSGRKRGHAKP